jgi:phospholipid/cholesterol/gamma-HCH transport system substrate-binding protein
VLAGVTALVVAVVLALALIPRHHEMHLAAVFPQTVSLYQGSDVRILGVPVGTVTSVTPRDTHVVVRMVYDAKYKVPRDAKAVIISPAIVGDRFVQLTPVYRHGPTLPDGARIGPNDTAVPLELDQIYQSIDDLTVALGPHGANSKGSLTRLLDSTARNFAGEGEHFHTTIKNLSLLMATLNDNKGNLFGTTRQIERFVSALSKNDKTVRAFNDSLASASGVLKGERHDLARALHDLGIAMKQVRQFVHENKHALSENITGLDRISKILVHQRGAVDEILRDAPTALTNLFHTYNPGTGTLDTRSNLGENVTNLTSDPAAFLCAVLHQSKAPKQACRTIRKVLPRSAPFHKAAGTHRVVQVEHIDRSLAGIVEVSKP